MDNQIHGLTPRELEIIKLIVDELSTKQIAQQLNISSRTVDAHRKNILIKTNSRSVVGLIRFAYKNALI